MKHSLLDCCCCRICSCDGRCCGVVIAVADDLVEVSIGSDDGLQAGHELEVFRADEYLGRLRVVSVKPDRAVVRVLKDFARGIVQRGDRVATRLKLDS